MSDRHLRPVILIVTHSNDNESIPLVMDAVAEQGGIAYRFDTDGFPTNIQLSNRYSGEIGRAHV